jgi:hypothetical protein
MLSERSGHDGVHSIAEQTAMMMDGRCAIIWRNKSFSTPFLVQ